MEGKCRLRGEFEYLQYTGENKKECLDFIRSAGYSEVTIDNWDLLMYCRFDIHRQLITEPPLIVPEGAFMLKMDVDKIEVYPEEVFNLSFVLA